MRIEHLELIGFKSFSERTLFNFHRGITAIVGPNGCGKSNIVDAFKWILGEQSAKSLRGDSMEDVIFSGSATKKSKGMAEVTLVISGINSSMGNGNSLQTDEVTITRRLYRSGESEYLMNKTPCRLKDIRNVFLDTGLELKTYSILEQGKIDVILNSKPLDRRFLIEEVAGVMKYNVRKAEAIQKLELAQSNLQRLQDIIAEVKRQINSIERYAKRAEKYKQLFEEIKSIEIKIAARDAILLYKELNNLIESESMLRLKEAELSSNIHSLDGLIEEKKLAHLETEKTLKEMQERLLSAEKNLIEEEGRLSLIKSDSENLKDRQKRLIARGDELVILLENISAKIIELEQKNSDMEIELANIEKLLNLRNVEFSNIEQEIIDLEQAIETRRKSIFGKAEELSAIRNEISNLILMKENLDVKEKKNLEDIELIKADIHATANAIKEAEAEYLRLNTELKTKHETKESLLSDVNEKKEKQLLLEESLYKHREELAALSSRLESLKELNAEKDTAIDEHIKILAQVADTFESLPEYETAIESVLGDKLSVAIVDDNLEIKKALDLMRVQKTNRRGFISMNVPPSTPSSNIESSDGVIGRAIDFVRTKEGFSNVATLLLNDVIIVNNLNTAFELRHKSSENPFRYFVTLDGEVLEPSGIVFYGIEKYILKMKREIRELSEQIEVKMRSIASTEEELSAIKKDIVSNEEELASMNTDISRFEKSSHELQMKTMHLNDENARHQRRLEYILAELEQDREENARIEITLKEKRESCTILEQEKHSMEEGLRNVQNEIGEKKSSYVNLRSVLTETVVSHTAIKEKKDSLQRERERLNSEASEVERKKEENLRIRHEIETNIAQKENEIKEKEDSMKSLVAVIIQLKEELSKINEIFEAKTAELNLMERQQKMQSEEFSSIRQELAQVEIRKTELTMKLSYLKENIKNTYYVELDNMINGGELPNILQEEEERLIDLKEKLHGIGPVNLGTLEELDELRTRYNFLAKQQDDLLQSIASLQETILKINSSTKKKLTDAFEALNEKFKEVFNILFGKGRAEIVLTSDNILEAGIDIVAQPPGKRLQNLMLLSGGEKALTAISLLFAGFMLKPTPLCLLDEVDAPLDESNINRFTLLVKELSNTIQFIIITHNRRTIEIADYIYGITMEEPGTSKVVSMRMAEAV